jgi:hypothetical protein
MMKKVLFALLCSFCFYGAQAQEINCKVENFDITSQESNRSTVIFLDDDGSGGTVMVRTLSASGSDPHKDVFGYVFEHYDSSMKMVKSYHWEVNESDGGLMGMVVKDGKIVYIDFRFNKSRKSFICNAYTASIDDFKFSKKELFAIKKGTIVRNTVGDINFKDRYGSMLLSADKSAFGIIIKAYNNTGEEISKINVYDTGSLVNNFTNDFKPDNNGMAFKIRDLNISDNGKSLFILASGVFDKKVSELTGSEYQFQLTRITATQTKSVLFEPATDYPSQLKIVMKHGKLACVGFYSNREDKYYTADKGFCYYELDTESMQVIKSKLNPFSGQFLQDKLGDENPKKLWLRYTLHSVFVTSKNEILFNAEEYNDYDPVHSVGSPSNRSLSYDDIISGKVSDSGELLWSRNINKEESTAYPLLGVSYTSFVNGDNVYFFFNARSEPEKLDDKRVLFNRDKKHKMSFYVLRINKDGNFIYKPLVNYEDADQIFYSAAFGCPGKDGKSIFFTGGREEQRKMMKITVE